MGRSAHPGFIGCPVPPGPMVSTSLYVINQLAFIGLTSNTFAVVKCQDDCITHGRGICDTKTGNCICNDGSYGEHCAGIPYKV